MTIKSRRPRFEAKGRAEEQSNDNIIIDDRDMPLVIAPYRVRTEVDTKAVGKMDMVMGLYQQETPPPVPTYIVSFTAPDGQSVTREVPEGNYILPALADLGITPAPGYTFQGYGTTITGGTVTQPGSTVNITANTTYYILYGVNVTLVNADNTSDTNITSARLEANFTFPANPFTPAEGRQFVSYNTTQAGTGTSYAPTATVQVVAPVTYYAIFEDIPAEG